jgi:uncharacterized protein (UPF0332 family)
MNGLQKTYWQKSKENLAVSEDARTRGYYNAAASRYYYALVLAGLAIFARAGTEYEWTNHPAFVFDISSIFFQRRYGAVEDIMDALEEAMSARVTADYEPYHVKPGHLERIQASCEPIWEALQLDFK